MGINFYTFKEIIWAVSQKWEINEGGAGFKNPTPPQPQGRGDMRSFGDHPNDSTPAVGFGAIFRLFPRPFPTNHSLAGTVHDAAAYNHIGS